MLTFLNSAILVGLAAVAIPILIHLFTRKKVKTVYFSSLRFLKELQKQKIRRLKIRQILLLIVRTLIILALILVFARPAIKTFTASALESGAKITAVIILDNTLSMGREVEGQRLLDKAKKQALDIVDRLRPGDEIYLIYPQDPPVMAHQGPRYNTDAVKELIAETELSFHKTDYLSALSMANDLMESSNNINKEVYLIGDMQRNGLRLASSADGVKFLGAGVNLFLLPVQSANSEDLDILNVKLGNQILEKDKVVEVETEIRNNGNRPAKDRLAHLFVNGKRVGQQAIDVDEASLARALFRMIPDRTGLQSGFVMLEDDDLLDDNRRYFTFRILDQIPVLIVTGHKSDAHYLEMAFQPEAKSVSYIRSNQIDYTKLTETNLEDYRALIFSNVPQIDNAASLKLQRFVANGGGLMVFLGDDVNPRNYNEYIQKKLNLPLLTETYGNPSDNQFLSLGKIDFSHPIFRGVFEGKADQIASPHIQFALHVRSDKPLDKIMEYSNGAPFLFESQYQQGRILYFTTGLSRDWSDLVYRGIFVPLLHRCVTYLAGGTSNERNEVLVGDEITYMPDRKYSDSELVMQKPDDSAVNIKPEVTKGEYLVRFKDTELPGIYTLKSGQTQVAQWAVNYDPAELETNAFKTDELKKYVAGDHIIEISDTGQIAEKLERTRYGHELWKQLVWIALVLLIVEALLMRENSEINRTEKVV